MTTLTVGSAFAGIGGIDLGLEAAGAGRTVWYSEVNPAALRVMAAQFPDAANLGSITELVQGLFPPPPVDIVTGGPPCQDISKGNAFGRKGLAGAKSGLFYAYAELIEQVKPRWVVMEQVTGLLTSGPNTGDDYRTVTETYRELGYETAVIIVNSLTYVPQTRERLIFVGSREPGAAARALLPLRSDGARDPGTLRPPKRAPAGPATGGAFGIYRKSRRPGHNLDGETWVNADYANTLTLNDVGQSRATVIVVDVNGRPRILTPEEWEGCHGFPSGWTEAAGSDVERWHRLGNTVSPPMIQRLGDGILAVENEQGRL